MSLLACVFEAWRQIGRTARLSQKEVAREKKRGSDPNLKLRLLSDCRLLAVVWLARFREDVGQSVRRAIPARGWTDVQSLLNWGISISPNLQK